ncbi:MAG TPA: DMT family transporter [Dongiaceae bacterium]|nr:DMT family transporter [Dongiaceae bacterium]
MSPLVILAALAAVILWGASPVAAKVAVGDLSAISVALLRTFVGGLMAVPVALAVRMPLPGTRRLKLILLLTGFCGFIAFPIPFTIGLKMTSANHASMILAALPITTGAIAMLWDRRRPTRIWIIGSVIALIGEAVLIGGRQGTGGVNQPSLAGDLLVLVSNFAASLGYVAGGRLQQAGYPSTGTTFWGAAAMALVLTPVVAALGLFGGLGAELAAAPAKSWIAILYLAAVSTILGYVLWYWALGKGGIARVGLMQFLQPVSGVILAAILLGEQVGASFLAASAVILFGVWLAIRGK